GRLGHTMLKVTYVNEEGCEIEIYYGFALVLDKIGEDTLMPGGVDHGRWEDWFGEGRIYDGSGVTDQELNLTDAQIAQIIKFLKELTDNPPNYTGYTNCASVVARKLKE